MGDTLPKEAAEAAPPPYTSIDPAVSNQRIEPLLPANHGGNPLVGPRQVSIMPFQSLQAQGSLAAAYIKSQ